MGIGKYILLGLTAALLVAVSIGGEEGFSIWLVIAMLTGALYYVGYMFFTSGKARILIGVTDSNGKEVQKAEVTVRLDGAVYKKARSDRKGKCMFYLPTKKSFHLKAQKGEFESPEESFNLSDKSMRGLSLVLSSRRVTVQITNEYNNPVGEAVVKVRGASFMESERSNANGKCSFMLPFEVGEVIVEKSGYAPARIPFEEDKVFIPVKLEPKFVTVRLTVVNERDQPVEGAGVTIQKEHHVTNEWGVMETKTRVGLREISVQKGEFLPVSLKVDLQDDFEQRVVLKEPRGQLEVAIVDAVTGERVPAKVSLLLFGSMPVEGTGDDGKINFGDIPLGRHLIRGAANGYHPKEQPVELKEHTVWDLKLEPVPALSDALVRELENVEAGLGTVVTNLSRGYDTILPRYLQSYCLTLTQLARRLPRTANLSPDLMVESIRAVCKDVLGIIEEKKLLAQPVASEDQIEFGSRVNDFSEPFKELIKDPRSFYEAHSSRVQQRIGEVDRKITEKMVEYEISPVTSLWKLAKKLASTRGDVAKNAISLFCADIALDYTERLFIVKEVADRLRKR